MLKNMLLKSMPKNHFLLATLFTISCVLSLGTARAASAPNQSRTVTVANITNKDLTVEIVQNRCAKATTLIKAYAPNSAASTIIKLGCPIIEGINIKGGPSQINMTVNSLQDLNLLLELDKDMQNILPTYFPTTDIKNWENNRARAQRNLGKILAFKTDKEKLERERKQALENNDKLFQGKNDVEYRKLLGFAPDQSIGLKWAHIKIRNQINQEFDQKMAELETLKNSSLEYTQ